MSSILPGSTRKRDEYAAFLSRLADRMATQYATKREHDGSTRGKSVDFVRQVFAGMRPDQIAFADHLLSSWGHRAWPAGKAIRCAGNYHVLAVRRAIQTALENID